MIKPKIVGPIVKITAALILLFAGGQAFAAQPSHVQSGADGLRISPVQTDLTIKPGTSQTINLSVTNVTSITGTYAAIVNDFTASGDESGTPAILVKPGQYSSGHSLKRFVRPIPNFTLKPNQEASVKATIVVPSTAAGGGYYGVVRFVPASLGSNPRNVTLAGSVGSLVLVKVPGDLRELVTLASFDIRKNDSQQAIFLSNKSLDAVARFKNSGNIQEDPFGKVVLKKGNKVLATEEVNNSNPPGHVLPSSIRRFSIPLKNVGSFGKFTVEGNFGYGSSGQLLSAKTTFYVIPLAFVITIVVVIILILLAIFALPRWLGAYNRRVVRRASRR